METQCFLDRPLGGGRPVPPNRSQRRKTSLANLLGIETFRGNSRCGAGIELQLRSRHSYYSFIKAWYVAVDGTLVVSFVQM